MADYDFEALRAELDAILTGDTDYNRAVGELAQYIRDSIKLAQTYHGMGHTAHTSVWVNNVNRYMDELRNLVATVNSAPKGN